MANNPDLLQKCKAIEKHLMRRSEFERIIIAMSSRLSRREKEPIDDIISQSLGEIHPATGSNRIFLFLFEKVTSCFMQVYEWKEESVASRTETFLTLIQLGQGWFEGLLKNVDTMRFEGIRDDPATPENIKNVLQEMDIDKLFIFPIFINYEIEGFLAFDINASIDEWLDEDFHFFRAILQFLGMALDRVITEEKLRKSEEKYRSILESIKESYFEINPQGTFTFFNYALCDLLGHAANEIMGKPLAYFLVDSDRVRFNQFFSALRKKAVPKLGIEIEARKKDGKRIFIEGTFYARQNTKKGGEGFYGFLRDVTERKKSEELREKFTQKLEIEVKMRTKELNDTLAQQKLYLDQILKSSQFKSEFMATMSHELRTPLNAIIGFSELLIERLYGDLNKDQIEYLSHIHSSADHLLEMINRILDISKIEAGKLQLNVEMVNIKDIVDHVDTVMRPLYKKKGLQFITKGLDADVPVYADPIRLKEILINLVSNAIKYTIHGSVTVSCTDDGRVVEISVIDTGVGIPEKHHGRVFKEFERIENPLSQSTQGTGLGLSLTRRLVHLHGGELTFNSVEGQGSTFTITIPKQFIGQRG